MRDVRRLAFWLVSSLTATALAGGQPVGWVQGLTSDRPEHYRLIRGGQRVSVGLLTPVHADDELSVEHDTHTLALALDRGRVIEEIRRESGAYVVRPGGEVPTVAGNLWAWAGSWFTTWHRETAGATVMGVYVRRQSGELALPLLMKGQARVVAGTRPAFFGWHGGEPPYEIRVQQDGAARALVVLRSEREPRVRVETLTLEPGHYTVEVVDRSGKQARESFRAVAPEQLPAAPHELQSRALPDPVRRTLAAAWLAALDRGQWSLEAYQTAAAETAASPLASLLRDSLERGDRPTGLPE